MKKNKTSKLTLKAPWSVIVMWISAFWLYLVVIFQTSNITGNLYRFFNTSLATGWILIFTLFIFVLPLIFKNSLTRIIGAVVLCCLSLISIIGLYTNVTKVWNVNTLSTLIPCVLIIIASIFWASNK